MTTYQVVSPFISVTVWFDSKLIFSLLINLINLLTASIQISLIGCFIVVKVGINNSELSVPSYPTIFKSLGMSMPLL